GGFNQTTNVAAGSLAKIYLPWVASLKGPDMDQCGSVTALNATVVAAGGAYHLVSTVPVTVYQFSPIEYKGQGGPNGKSWATCPGTTKKCILAGNQPIGCFSFTNDASLLLPSTAMTGTYRITGHQGWSVT